MGLFFEMLSAINDPTRQGSVDQLGSVMNTIQQLGASRGINAPTLQVAMSALSGFIAPALKQQSLTGDSQSLNNLVNQFASAGTGAAALQTFLTPQLQQQIIQGIAQKTGLSASTLQTLLPGLVTAAMGFLSMGASKPGVAGSNSVLNAFLDGDRDGTPDLGDVFKFAGRFLNAPS